MRKSRKFASHGEMVTKDVEAVRQLPERSAGVLSKVV